jgi:Ca2+-binding RTX toxin-like protein
MATFTFKSPNGNPVNYDNGVYGSDDTFYEFESFSSTRFKEYNDASNYLLLEGRGFTRAGDGTIKKITIAENGIKKIQISGLSLSVKKVGELENDPEGLALYLTKGDDIVTCTQYDDLWRAGSGNDKVYGEFGNDRLYGNGGNDRLYGQRGNDKLYGSSGNDYLKGGSGADRLNGGSGSDKFVYGTASEGKDAITLFDSSDVLVFEGSAFKLGTYKGTLKKANFETRALGHAADDRNDYFIFDRKTDSLWFDADGSRSGDAVMIADFDNNFALSYTDIAIV